jgi:hypothetical protein
MDALPRKKQVSRQRGARRSLSQRQQERDLQLQLALGNDSPGIDLRGADLSGSYLVDKNVREAKKGGS